ncbi:MAG TPA: right-handed parallel beta-helix repeat-containing protein, partial [Flavisolibacter sp.]|nr:right-handed parallel beta-helix repeat-containing protein [Flavisolibacter sp.]
MGKLYASVNVAKVLLFSTLTIFLSLSAHTQTTVVINTGTPGTAAHNAGPIYRATASSTVDASRFVYLYTQDELAAVGILPGSVISRLGWVKSNDATTTGTVSGIFRIYLKNSSATAFAAASQTWATLNTGASLVYQNLTQTIPATADPDYITFNLTNFTYTGGSLEVSTEWDINAATGNPSTGPFSWLWSTVPDKIYGIAATTLAGTATLSSTIVNGTTVSLDNRRPFIQITFLPPPCPEPPTPGTAITNKSVICLNESFTLSLSGASGGNGQTHQWQSSPDNVNWTNIAGATNLSLTTTQANTSYYRAILTCGTTSLPSASVLVTSTPPVSGTFLIDAGGTGNFTSFTAAYNFIKCGINGPVTINVKPNSGPYNEQLVMDTIAGASSTNTVTFNGNGNTITYLSTNTNERAVIKMNGTDHVTFDNLVIKAAGSLATEFGWGIQLANNADSNTIRNCVINIDTTNTNTNYAGIVISASNTSAVGTGTVQCDYNTFDNNTVTGGYYGMTLVGSSAVANGHNRIINNTFSEFYFYGVFINGSFNTLIDSNTITRPTRPNVSTFTGIYLNGLNTRVKVQRNVITNPFGGNPGSTNTFNGIHFNASDASAQLENIVSNNLIYNITGNGDVNGIFNAGSDNAWYYHNTVYLDGVSTDATDIIRGFHQTTTAAGIQFVNNIVHISRTGPSSKYVMYFNTPASDIISNYNDLFISSTEGSNNIGYNGNDQVLLVNWRTATGQDANSVSNDPVYENAPAGNFVPTNSVINNLGTAAATLVPTDLAGATRDAATPDMGAYEFAPPVCVSPPVAGDAIVSATPVCENTLVNLDVTANSTGTGQTYVWQAASDIAGPYAPISTTLTNPSFVITATASLYYRVAVTCSGNTSFSTPVFLSVNPALPGGTYTIDANQPASPTNFVSFNAAKEAMACGIAGPVVFEVEPNSGPYLEQLELDSIPGTSASNTVTFNGNGNIIKFVPTVSAQRAVIKLTGTDYVTFDSLTIDATEGAFGFGVQLVSNADSNTFTRCYIIADTSSTSTGYAGIVLGSSATSATTNGVSLCDGNVFDGNKIMGGHYGIAMVGNTANPVLNNKVLNNRIEDFYSYGVYVDISTKTLIQGNTISRPNRTVFAAFNGIYFTGASSNALIAKNRLTNPAGGDPTATDAVNGIYFTSSDAPASAPNRVVNNMIYHLNGNGTVYALYNSGSNNILYYHNTISIDHQVTTSTSATRGFYQTLSADGIEVKNNIINITRPGTGDKHGLYFGTAASTIVSNRNNVFVNGPSAVDNFFGFFGSNRVTLSDWQTASSQDANSTSIDPIFFNAAAGNFIPMQGVVDNIGEPVGVTTDIFNAPRSGTTPDAGAIEFSVIPCVTPPTPGVSVATPASNICLGQKIQLNLSGNSTGGFQKYIWQISSSATGPWTDLSDTLFSPEFEHELSSYTNTYFRAIVICSGVQDISTPVQVLLNPALVAGDYTIDPASPVSPTNFQSFATAVAALQCGIAGSVRFHVVPGTYNEQMRISRVPGASATSTVTFMSQNGDPASVTISYNSTSADSNYVVKLDSASFITYKNMTITATNATNARAVEFAGTASVDSLVNLRISAPEVATTSNTTAAVFGTALRGSDIVLKGNTILNGSSGIYLSGTTRVSDRYIVDSNIVSGSYQYGIYLANINSTSATRNKVARSGLLNTSAYGLYLSNCDSAYRVRSNEVTINNTGTAVYGIYLTGCQASAANPGIVNNNKITAAAENTGNQYGLYATSVTFTRMLNNVIVVNTAGATSYGIYNTSTGGVQYYNNTVQSSATSTTANFAAYFSQSSAANGPLNIRNNIFSHTGAGRAMNVINPRFIYSDYNMFYTNGDSIINWGTTAYKSLQNWRDTSYHDFNSIVYRPAFTSTTDLTPDLASPDVWAIHGRGEQITGNDVDFNGNPRPTTLTAG